MAITATKRAPKRMPLLLPAQLEGRSWKVQGRIRDLSVAGALMDSDDIVPADANVVLACRDLKVSGRVAWVDENRSGIEFDIPLEEEVVTSVRGSGLVVSAPRSLRLQEQGHAA